MKKINVLQHADAEQLARDISMQAGVIKLFVGSNNNAAIVVMRDAFDAVRRSPYYCGRTKKLFNEAMEELRMYYHRLKHPQFGELTLFDVKDFDTEFRSNYREDITNDQYFEFWESVGYELYYRTSKLIVSAEWKFRRHFEKEGYKAAAEIARIIMASNLLNISVEMFENSVKIASQSLPATDPDFRRMMQAISIEPVYLRWRRAVNSLPDSTRKLSDTEMHDISTIITQIADQWADPELVHQIQMDMVKEMKDEIYDSDMMYRKVIKRQREAHEEILRQMESIKTEKMLENLRKKAES